LGVGLRPLVLVADRLWKEAVKDLVLVPSAWVNYLVLARNVLEKLGRPSNEVPYVLTWLLVKQDVGLKLVPRK